MQKKITREPNERDFTDNHEASSPEQSDSEDMDEVMDTVTEEELSKHRVFNTDAKHRVDETVKKLHQHLKWQSDRALPRLNFPNGITTLTKMQGNERTGVVLLLLIVFVMDYWAEWRCDGDKIPPKEPGYLVTSLGKRRVANIIKTLALMLAFESWLRLDKIPKKDVEIASEFMPYFSDQVLQTFSRQEGTGNNTVKNHLLLHVPDFV